MYVSIADESIYIATGGVALDKNKPGIIFIHGAGLDHTVWVLFNRFFAHHGFNSLAIDLPGHGKSTGQALKSVEQLAEWLGQLLNVLQLTTVNLVGHSMGSLIALETAARNKQTIHTTVLMGTAAPMPVGEALLDAAKAQHHSAVDMIMLFGHAYASQLGGNPVAGIHILNNNMRLLERGLRNTLFTDLNACHEYHTGLHMATKIEHPVHVLMGEEDKMTPAKATTALIHALDNVTVHSLKDTGHMMPSENPEHVHQALVAALL